MLLIAVCYGVFAQGAFYGSQLFILEILLVVAFILAIRENPPSRSDFRNPITLACLLVVSTSIVSAARVGSMGSAIPLAAFLLVLLATALAVRRVHRTGVETVLHGITVATSIVAFLGWLAVATHAEPGALINGALWRASTTVSYANAAACLFAMVALIALARASATQSLANECLTYVVLVGLGSTLSRGALLGLALGLAFAILSGNQQVVTKEWHVLAAAFIALAGLIPSISAKSRPHLLIATLALLAGASILVARRLMRPESLAAALFMLVVAVGIAIAVTRPPAFDEGVRQVSSARLGRDISVRDRQARWATFLRIARSDPIFGAGPGGFLLRYPNPAKLDVGQFAHNEYLQILAEQGALGLTALAVGIGIMARSVISVRRRDWAWIGSSSALVVFLVQGTTDFVWNVPLIPVVATILVTTASGPAVQGADGPIVSGVPDPLGSDRQV